MPCSGLAMSEASFIAMVFPWSACQCRAFTLTWQSRWQRVQQGSCDATDDRRDRAWADGRGAGRPADGGGLSRPRLRHRPGQECAARRARREAAASLAEVAACGVIALAVFSTDQVEEVVEQALLPAAKPGTVVLCTSTCDPDRIEALGERLSGGKLRFLETPVSGTSEQVRQGDGVGLIGGDPADRGGDCGRSRCAVPAALPYRQDRRRRPRQARGQSDPGAEPHGAGGRADLRRAHGARRQGVPRRWRKARRRTPR